MKLQLCWNSTFSKQCIELLFQSRAGSSQASHDLCCPLKILLDSSVRPADGNRSFQIAQVVQFIGKFYKLRTPTHVRSMLNLQPLSFVLWQHFVVRYFHDNICNGNICKQCPQYDKIISVTMQYRCNNNKMLVNFPTENCQKSESVLLLMLIKETQMSNTA